MAEKLTNKAFFIDRHAGGDRAVLVHVDLYQQDTADMLREFEELVHSAGVLNLALVTARRSKPTVNYFVGRGKVDAIRNAVQATEANVVIVNHDLSPSQERNLEKALLCRVLDRTGLILDIFAQRARSFEGKLQVELAQLKHLSTRLVRGWTHLERQKGGIGLRGPGETQLETDRRLLAVRIKSINKSLARVSQQRYQSRRARQRADVPSISLVGYTNAGKSTLFNALTKAETYVADQLFATLDPALRVLPLPPLKKVIIADTVGFVRDLPHDLIAAFRATLEETRQASLLLHVIDAHHAERQTLIQAVDTVLTEIGANEQPVLQVYNKIDLRGDVAPKIDYHEDGKPWRVWCSALHGEGLMLLEQAISELLATATVTCELHLAAEIAGRVRANFYNRNVVNAERICKNGDVCLTITIEQRELAQLLTVKGITRLSV